MTQPMFKCSVCKSTYRGERGEKHRSRMGCTDYNARPQQFYRPDSGGGQKIIYDSCMANYASNEWIEILNFYELFKKGVMMFPGSYSEQPAKFVSVMNFLDNLVNEEQERKNKAIRGKKRS